MPTLEEALERARNYVPPYDRKENDFLDEYKGQEVSGKTKSKGQ